MARTIEESFFFRNAFQRLVVHRQHFAGVENFDAGIAEPRLLAGGIDFSLIANEINRGDGPVCIECLFDAFDDDPATVVATHDIHCNSHK